MGNFRQNLKCFIVNNPEGALELLNAVASIIPEVIKVAVEIKNDGVCNYLDKKIENLFSKKKDGYSLPVYRATEGATPSHRVLSYSMRQKIDYGDQLETLLPVVVFIIEVCKQNKVLWDLGTAENSYTCAFIFENAQYNCAVELESNSHAFLEILIKYSNQDDKYLCIGKSQHPIHPELNKKLSELFFLAEEKALNMSRAVNKDVSLDANTKIIARFLDDLSQATKKNLVKWKQNAKNVNSFTTTINKRNGVKIIVQVNCLDNADTEVRVAQLVASKLSKLLHLKDDDCKSFTEVQVLLDRLKYQIKNNITLDNLVQG